MPVVGPIKETNVLVVYDTDSGGFGGPLDMKGPEIGRVNYSQPGGNLVLKINLEFGQPSTKYQVFLVCGPAHSASCGFVTVGVLATDAAGAGSVNITVPAAVLESAPFGPGFRNDHIDLLRGVGDLSKGGLTAGAINYYVCKRAPGTKAAAKPVPREMQQVSEGDPLAGKKK
ncbi:MAG TPA: hypothetical protein VK619_16330 [Pyrinomonadaceae bacterium]|nr:hypothetical protein [Pyrinomonadaceae bacterium]